ncbi:hypothetical protein BDZ90DRAFT_229498 [Jaminaea rosea]|uniref:CUE domain-containing protein n=1 Tax=Jaminaea rosea TaxID=1569628 RepID=A0A316UYT7_9BASI|nr:hypothetical protein BDZ90DRAFT_229498 [Jaminaea rosea]PWN30477.1 hypothetical protein BDZ90DRAFT_229498 [Jaminaea rosea]
MAGRREQDVGGGPTAAGLHASAGATNLAALANRRPSPSSPAASYSHLETTDEKDPSSMYAAPAAGANQHHAASSPGVDYATPPLPRSHSRTASTSSASPRQSRRSSAAPLSSPSHSRKASLAGLAEHPSSSRTTPLIDESNTSPSSAGYIFDSSFFNSWGAANNANMLGVSTPTSSSIGGSRRGSAMPYVGGYPLSSRQASTTGSIPLSGVSAAALGMMSMAGGNGTSSGSSSPRSAVFPHLGEGISGVADEGIGGEVAGDGQMQAARAHHKPRMSKKGGRRSRSTSTRSASSALSPEVGGLPLVPKRRSSARNGSSPEDVVAEELLPAQLPPSPPIPSDQAQPADMRHSQSSDLSDYGSQADEDEDEGTRRINTVDMGSSSTGDYSNVLQLAGGPPKLQRPQRGPLSPESAISRRDLAASPSSASASGSTSHSLHSSNASGAPAAMTRSLSPRKPRVEPGMERQRSTLSHSSIPMTPVESAESDEAALEAAALRDADREDPNRPRTLKEARELAKARAQARQDPQPTAPAPAPAQLAAVMTPSSSKRFGQVSPKSSEDPATMPNSAESTMDELQAAVGSALSNLDFSPTAGEESFDTTSTASVPGDYVPATPVVNRSESRADEGVERASLEMAYDSAREFDEEDARDQVAQTPRRQQDRETSASGLGLGGDVTPSAAGERPPAADRSTSSTSIAMLRQKSSRSIAPASPTEEQKYVKGGPRDVAERPGALSLSQALALDGPPTPVVSQDDWKTPRSIPKRMASVAQFNEPAGASTPTAAPPPAAVLAPPTRITVPGKTVPFPPSFHVSAISVDKRRAPPWERAKAYAQFTNELCSTPSGISLWIEAATRRPIPNSHSGGKASLMPGSGLGGGPRYPASVSAAGARSATTTADGGFAVHPRDVSNASVRSDQTFPIRGDGGKARDITQIPLDTSQPDAYPGAVPSSIPYPSLVHQPSRSLSGAGSAAPSMSMTPSASSTGSQSQSQSVGLRARKISSGALDVLNSLSSAASPAAKADRPSGTFSRPALPTSSSSSSSSNTRQGGGGFLGSLGRRNSKRSVQSPGAPTGMTMTSSSSQRSVADVGNTSSTSLSGPRGPRIPGAAGALGRAIGNVSRHHGAQSNTAAQSSTGVNAAGSIDLGVMARNPETANLGLAMTRGSASTDAARGPSDASSSAPAPRPAAVIPEGVSASPSGTLSGPRGPRAPGTLRNSPSVQRLNASASPVEGGGAGAGTAPTFIPSYPGGGASPPKKLSPLHTPTTGHGAGSQRTSPQPADAGPRVGKTSPQPSDYAAGNGNSSSGRSGAMEDRPEFKEALRKLVDVLPDADEDVLSGYLRRAAGNDLRAIGDYLGDQATGSLKRR